MTYKLFICHAYDHQSIYFDLVKKLNAIKSFDWRNNSVQYDMRFGTEDGEVDNDELRSEIAKRIAECDALLVLTKPVASRRRWLQWEISYARDLGIPVIGIARKLKDRTSVYVRKNSDDIVDTWRADHIINAVEQYADSYRARRSTAIILPPPAALPPEKPDTEIDLVPTPVPPDEAAGRAVVAVEVDRDAGGPARPPLPKDVIFKDGLGGYVPARLNAGAVEQQAPKWWWPFR